MAPEGEILTQLPLHKYEENNESRRKRSVLISVDIMKKFGQHLLRLTEEKKLPKMRRKRVVQAITPAVVSGAIALGKVITAGITGVAVGAGGAVLVAEVSKLIISAVAYL